MGTHIICQLLLAEDNRTVPLSSLKAKITDNLSEYEWSSYTEYITGKEGLADKEFVSELLPKEEFIDFHNTEEELVFTVDDKTKITDDAIRINILKELGIEAKRIGELEKSVRNELLRRLKSKYSIRQIERVTGISRGVIHKS